MSWFDALILGIIQGLTEFLPVSSSGHLEIGKVLLGVTLKEEVTFTIVVHGATVCSTIVVFYRELGDIFKGLFRFQWNPPTIYATKLVLSCIPVAIVALFFEKQVEQLFSGDILLVGFMLLVTALLLAITFYTKPGEKEISFIGALLIGIAQAIAVIPGISRSGATIATGLYLGNKRENVARFSFLMVLLPIIGKNLLDVFSGSLGKDQIGALPLVIGFLAAFFTGWIACRLMIEVVKKSKLIYFALYCFVIGTVAIIFTVLP